MPPLNSIPRSIFTAVGDLLYGSGANTPARLAGNPSTTRMFLSQIGNGSVPGAPELVTLPTSTFGSATLDANYPIGADAGTWVEVTGGGGSPTTYELALPSAGTYEIRAEVRVNHQLASGSLGGVSLKFYNATGAADVGSVRMAVSTSLTSRLDVTCSITARVTVAGATSIRLYAMRHGTGTPVWTVSAINASSTTNGGTVMYYLKIA